MWQRVYERLHTSCGRQVAGTWTRWVATECTRLPAPSWMTGAQRVHRPPACWWLSHGIGSYVIISLYFYTSYRRCQKATVLHQHLITQFFTDRMLFLTPNRQWQSTKGNIDLKYVINKHDQKLSDIGVKKLAQRCSIHSLVSQLLGQYRVIFSWWFFDDSALSFLRCFDTVGWATEKLPSVRKKPTSIIRKGCVLGTHTNVQ